MVEERKGSSAEAFPMKGGDGPCSYFNNSKPQRELADWWKAKMIKAIEERLELDHLCSFKMADLGCSVGPNTFISMKNFIEAIDRISRDKKLSSELLEFQVFFNDHITNDFNTLFSNLPQDRKYFAAAVAGSFHGRLFPKASLNFVHSSYALQWLSKVPEGVGDLASPFCNKGKIFYNNAPVEVCQAYSNQYAEDMKVFLAARATEIVPGGLMAMLFPIRTKGKLTGECSLGPLFQLLEDSLVKLVDQGMIRKDQLDSFNLPLYSPSEEELRTLVEESSYFEVVVVEVTVPTAVPLTGATGSRAAFESILVKHFGNDIIDPLYHIYSEKMSGLPPQIYSDEIALGCFALFKRKRKHKHKHKHG